jgi:hypothetical protein
MKSVSWAILTARSSATRSEAIAPIKALLRLLYRLDVWSARSEYAHTYLPMYEVVVEEAVKHGAKHGK